MEDGIGSAATPSTSVNDARRVVYVVSEELAKVSLSCPASVAKLTHPDLVSPTLKSRSISSCALACQRVWSFSES